MTEAEFTSLAVSFRTFFLEKWARWEFMLSRGERRWKQISPVDVWPHLSVQLKEPAALAAESGLNIDGDKRLAAHRDEQVVVFSCGSARQAAVLSMRLTEFSTLCWARDGLWEGFVSIVPGQLLLGWTHEGGAHVWSKPRRRK